MLRSLLKWFPLFIGFCLLISSVSNSRPDTGSGGGLLFRFAGSVVVRGGRGAADRYCWLARVGSTHSVLDTLGLPHSWVCAFPVYTAQAPGCSIWRVPCVACCSSFRVFHKSVDLVGPAFCAFPTGAAQAARSLTGAFSLGAGRLLPSVAPAPAPARAGQVCAPCV